MMTECSDCTLVCFRHSLFTGNVTFPREAAQLYTRLSVWTERNRSELVSVKASLEFITI